MRLFYLPLNLSEKQAVTRNELNLPQFFDDCRLSGTFKSKNINEKT